MYVCDNETMDGRGSCRGFAAATTPTANETYQNKATQPACDGTLQPQQVRCTGHEQAQTHTHTQPLPMPYPVCLHTHDTQAAHPSPSQPAAWCTALCAVPKQYIRHHTVQQSQSAPHSTARIAANHQISSCGTRRFRQTTHAAVADVWSARHGCSNMRDHL